MKRIEIIEFLKGYSIFTIVIFHFLQSVHFQNVFGKLISFGGTGVHLFILLSGFGLYYSHIHKPLSFISFIKKRISKIYFPYIIIVILSAFIALFIPLFKSSLYTLGGHIFLYKMFDESIIGSYGYPLWFISMIFQFYLVFNLIVFIKERTNISIFIYICFGISIIWTIIVILLEKENVRVWNSFFFRYLWEFGLGIVLASEYKRYNFSLKIKPIYFLIIGISNCTLYALLALKGGDIGKITNDVPALIGYSSLAIWLYLINIKFINSFLIYTGKISYSLYLLHSLTLLLVLYYLTWLNISASLIIAIILTYILAYLYQQSIIFIFKKKE